MYSFLRNFLFLFSPERIHNWVFYYFRFAQFVRIPLFFMRLNSQKKSDITGINLWGLDFPHRVGLAAGLDKNAEAVEALGDMGFAFVEVGTVTPLGQPGNPKPRLFRLRNDGALINRMGFNNHGVDNMINRLKSRKYNVIIGGNIGKNKNTPNENAWLDYKICFEKSYPYVDYFVVNVSSPNTPNLRELQDKEPLTQLLSELMKLNKETSKEKPILLKIAPDLNHAQLDDIVDIVNSTGIHGIVATNTTLSRENLHYSKEYIEEIGAGGLSGKPLAKKSTEVIEYIHKKSLGKITIVAAGGIMTPEDALNKIKAGASLVQLYTGFIYEGPALIKRINKLLEKHL